MDTSRPPRNPLHHKKPRGRPFPKGVPRPAGAGRKKGTPNKVPCTAKEFLIAVVNSQEYQIKAKERLLAGIAVGLEQLAHYYASGKPGESVMVTADNNLQALWTAAAARGLGEKPS